MSLAQTALNLGVKRKDTCKLFFGVFPYSLVLPIPQELIDDKAEAMANYHRLFERRRAQLAPYHRKGGDLPKLPEIKPSINQIKAIYKDGVHAIIDALVGANQHILADGEYYADFNRSNITFYVKDEATALALLTTNKGLFSSITEPHNADVARFLEKCSEKRVVVRERLFEDEYEFRIDFKKRPGLEYDSLDERVERMFFHKKLYSRGVYRKLYLNGEDDLILARLGLDDCIETITKCVLRDAVPAN